MNLKQTNNRSLLHCIFINAKDNLILSGSYEALQMFVEEVLDMSDGVWDCQEGDAKRYKSGKYKYEMVSRLQMYYIKWRT